MIHRLLLSVRVKIKLCIFSRGLIFWVCVKCCLCVFVCYALITCYSVRDSGFFAYQILFFCNRWCILLQIKRMFHRQVEIVWWAWLSWPHSVLVSVGG